MYCGVCNSEIKDGSKFCNVCGAVVESSALAEDTVTDLDATVASPMPALAKKAPKEKKKLSKGKKALIIICLILVLLIGLAIAALVYVLESPAKEVTDLLDEKEYDDAIELYEDDVKDDFIQEILLERFIIGFPEEVSEAYVSEELTALQSLKALYAVKEMKVCEASDINARIDYINELQGSRDAYSNAVELYEEGDYIAASTEFGKVIESDPDYGDAKAKLDECKKMYKEYVLGQVASPVSDSDYEAAIAILESAAEVMPEDAEITGKLDSFKLTYAQSLKERAFSQSVTLLEQKKYTEAFEIISKAAAYNSGDAEITALLSSVTTEYEAYIIQTADEYLAKYDYVNAQLVVEEALIALPENKTFADKKAAIEAAKPVSLKNELMINSSCWKWDNGEPIDSFNNEYYTASNYVILGNYSDYSSMAYGEFRVYGKYKKLSGKITPHRDIKENEEIFIQIYADDTLIYTSPKIGRKTDTVVFDVNLSQADYVKIIVHYPQRNYTSGWSGLILSDLMLHS